MHHFSKPLSSSKIKIGTVVTLLLSFSFFNQLITRLAVYIYIYAIVAEITFTFKKPFFYYIRHNFNLEDCLTFYILLNIINSDIENIRFFVLKNFWNENITANFLRGYST